MNKKEKYIIEVARRARQAALQLAAVSSKEKNRALVAMADALWQSRAAIIAANINDLENGKKKGLSEAMLDRLSLSEKRVKEMCDGLVHVSRLNDPVGEILWERKREDVLVIRKVRVPIGVIAVIYEARPNVTADSAGLCVKSGNAVILRGGSEAINSNMGVVEALNQGAVKAGLPADAVQLIRYTERELMLPLLRQNELIDLVIPRGGEGLIRYVAEHSTIPVIKHYKGICHVYVDKDADLAMAESIIVNAKVQRPAVCNALETLLIHKAVAPRFLPRIVDALKAKDVEVRCDAAGRRLVKGVKAATERDWSTEYLDLILSVRIVDDLDAAIGHINTYGSRHSDAIVTRNAAAAKKFMATVDSSAVFHNASTRLNDGGQFGFGAEIGISTDKIHARGPMGLEELTSYKYVVIGKGHIRK
ncbi:MAG TPA: glutamate-5-semialdehyde dehydrogenase [bacterium]|nr:glutamate-5-semialdehyde dehydrogenase [bacterium]